ncbi:MAG TPA: methyltransferase domain-containing protein, partial [Ardenticatenaceae bacterium]|nr:methyltransferase domain-containing protein [Ardenticatenaceae bacterium]
TMVTEERRDDLARCDYEGSTYQQSFWTAERQYEDRAERVALRKLLPPHGRRLVEIGAGAGRLADLYLGYDEIYLVDYAHSQLEQAHAHWGTDPRFTFVQGDIYDLPFATGYFDTVVTVRVLHHVRQLQVAFDSIGRIVAGGGVYVTEFANKRNLKAIGRYLLNRGRRGVNPFSLDPYEFVELNIDYHPAHLLWELRQAGFEVEQELGVSFFRVPGLKSLVPAGALARLDGWLQRPLAPLRLTPSIFVRARRSEESLEAKAPGGPWRCPACHGVQVETGSEGLICSGCGSTYPIINGIAQMRRD